MAVAAPIDGVVVYRTNWRGEKKKVGDDCEVGEPCLAVTDIREMEALGEVDEVESARVAVGQTVRLRLEALPELEWPGTVASLRPNVYRQSPRNPLKVMGLSDQARPAPTPRACAPGMQFRGRLETGRVPGAVLAPVRRCSPRPEGPVVFRKTATGWEKVPVTVGRARAPRWRSRAGLQPGDRVAGAAISRRRAREAACCRSALSSLVAVVAGGAWCWRGRRFFAHRRPAQRRRAGVRGEAGALHPHGQRRGVPAAGEGHAADRARPRGGRC